MSKRAIALAIGPILVLTATAGGAETPKSGDQSLSVTIYAGDLALVQDRRTVDLTGGRQRLEFDALAAALDLDVAAILHQRQIIGVNRER